MRAKSLILLVVALGCGMIAAVGVSKAVMDKGPTEVVEATVEIFVAVKDLPHGQKISAENVKLEKWAKSRVPEGALTSLEQVEAKYTKQMIFAGEPLLDRKLDDSRESFSTHIPPGHRIFDILGSAGYIKPGDHVDIIGTFALGGRGAVPESRTVMRNVQVFGINGVTTRDSDSANVGKGSVFQLLVKESQMEALTLANRMGELRLNLRPFEEEAETGADNGESFLSWINESEEEKTPVLPQQVAAVSATVQGLFGGAAEPTEPKHEMLIITPNGMKKYQWSDNSEIPREVTEEANDGYRSQSSAMTANQYGGASENVYSGYGGYSPTYPTSTAPQQPATGVVAPSTGAKNSAVN